MPRPGLIALMGRKPAAPPGGQLFSDNFDRPNAPDLGPDWVSNYGSSVTWYVASNLAARGPGEALGVWATPCDTDDNYAQYEHISITGGGQGFGPMCRVQGGGVKTYYMLLNNGQIFKCVGGTFTGLGTPGGAVSLGQTMRVEAVGSTITGYYDGTPVAQVTDTSIPTGRYVGMRSNSTGAANVDQFEGGDI